MNDIEITKKNLSDFNVAGLAQLVEHLICNQGARGSNPLAGTIFFNYLQDESTEQSAHV